MEKAIITTGKTIELAIEEALKKLGLDRDSVSVEVLKNAKTGFLGIGSSPAEVKVTYEAADEAPAASKGALSAASRTAKPKEKPAAGSTIISRPGKRVAPETATAKPAAARLERREATVSRDRRPEQNRDRRPEQNRDRRPERKAEPAAQRAPRPEYKPAPAAKKDYAPAAPGSVEEQIETFLKGLLQHMGSDAVPHAYHLDGESYRADLVGGDAGLLIGRRGDTLDAIQYLTGYAVNREREERLRISVDAGEYRFKREESLRQLANKMAAKAVKYRRNFTLEPMNAYERHIIHAALQEYTGVTTFSTGTEPHRRVVVAFAKEA